MAQYAPIEDLDDIEEKCPDGTKIADYVIRDVVVIELKTLKEDPTKKMENFFHEIMKRPDFPAIYGELNFRRVVSLLPDGEKQIRKFETVAFRQIESIMSKANKQVISTIEHLKMDNQTAGTLIILNEFAEFFEPDVLVGYISKMLGTKSGNGLRFSHINRVILIQDTHKIKDSNQSGIAIPIYNILNDNIAQNDITKQADMALNELIKSYSQFNQCNHKLHKPFEDGFEIEKLHQPEVKKPLKGQEWIEDQYRKNRYMKNFTDEQLIELGSMVMSVCYAMVLKERPLVLEHHRKMQLFKTQIELFEESRLRPFDLRRLDINPRRYAPK
ncbi:hypothetical protein L1D28_01920 [Vibrio chagasii]|uniref:hypothetical protein n=1 Tax=Vibrio chagasii TaxID=170679 RepID=UPI001EFEDF59|nr:hypothetical protein [Vibrio chagasii]MCG9560394.1 hypothetical protein [Vibrio chagasii]